MIRGGQDAGQFWRREGGTKEMGFFFYRRCAGTHSLSDGPLRSDKSVPESFSCQGENNLSYLSHLTMLFQRALAAWP